MVPREQEALGTVVLAHHRFVDAAAVLEVEVPMVDAWACTRGVVLRVYTSLHEVVLGATSHRTHHKSARTPATKTHTRLFLALTMARLEATCRLSPLPTPKPAAPRQLPMTSSVFIDGLFPFAVMFDTREL